MAVDLTWSSPTAAQSSSGLALVTGDILTQTSWQATVSNIYLLSQLAQGPGQLQYVSATSIRFRSVNGSVIRIAGALYNLTADIASANTNIYIDGASGSSLGASTLYYVYLFLVGSALTIDFSTTAYAIDSTTGNYGTYIKTGVASRTLIGMIRTNSSSQFVDSATQRFVLSWFNKRPLQGTNEFSAARTTTSTTATEINSEIRVEYLTWASEASWHCVRAQVSNDTNASQVAFGVGIDSTTSLTNKAIFMTSPTGGQAYGGSVAFWTTLSEGYHYTTLLGLVDGNTGTFADSAGPNSQGNSRVEVGIWG